MIKQILASCLLLTALSISSLPANAQTDSSKPTAPESTDPAPKPTQSTPAPTNTPAPTTETISPAELKKVANVVKEILVIEQNGNKAALAAIQQEGFQSEAQIKRFEEIYNAKTDPKITLKTPITADEQKKYDRIMPKLTAIQKSARENMGKAMAKQQIQPERFSQIIVAVRKNPQLQQDLIKIMNE